MSKLSNVKIKKYKEYLKYPYWTFSEAILLLSSIIDFGAFCRIHPAMRPMFGRDRFGLFSCELGDHIEVNSLLKESILKVIREDKINAFPIRMRGITCPPFPDGIMYFFDPYEIIAFVVTEGFQLPQELQKAANIYQMDNLDTPLTIPSKKQIKRQVLAMAFWHKYPKFTISEISRRFERLKKYREFRFINDSENRNRKVIKELKPPNSKAHLMLPGIFEKLNGKIMFDFQRLKIVVNTIADLLMLADRNTTPSDILSHELIHLYISAGGKQIKSIIEFSLQDTFEYLYQINQSNEN